MSCFVLQFYVTGYFFSQRKFCKFHKVNEAFLVFYLAGLDAGKIKQVGTIRGQESTRRIGDYKVKYGYTDIELLRSEKLSCGVSSPPFLHHHSIVLYYVTIKC